jgi:nitrogen-specific signal transduction histidine kinase/CheY-like chemotaxis protein
MLSILVEILDLHFSAKEREVSLISFADKAENANKAKDMFLANMSHELRTPLNAIMAFSQIVMMKKEIPDDAKKYVKKINIAGNNLLDLVNTILDFAKLESGKMQFTPRLNNISKVLDEVSILVSPLALSKSISLSMPNIISLNLYIDDKLFKQVLINLLTNAIKFTAKEGTVSLSIQYDAQKRMYQFEVKDDGIGLSNESINSLFQAFSQVDNIYQKTEQGTGLGLMISKKIIEDLHKGQIWVESVEGEGSSFFITMPTPMIESHTYEINEAPKGSRKALVVEDSPAYQKILAEHLKESISLTFTDTVNKAKHLIVENSYDFLILDFFLTDGISSEVLEFMEEENIEIPTIVISAEDEIQISSSLSGSSNLEGIINKNNIDNICASIKGEVFIPSSS